MFSANHKPNKLGQLKGVGQLLSQARHTHCGLNHYYIHPHSQKITELIRPKHKHKHNVRHNHTRLTPPQVTTRVVVVACAMRMSVFQCLKKTFATDANIMARLVINVRAHFFFLARVV